MNHRITLFVAYTTFALLSLPAQAQRMSAADCTQLLQTIRATKDNYAQAQGDGSQQAYIAQALQQYITVYQQFCQ